tara:strand:+ start:2460 stop:3575 length:1116 start_codon:yes stop_codon:yes gene_type:complete
MGLTLTGTKPKDTYKGLMKFSNNEPLNNNYRYLSDGYGNDSALEISTTSIRVNGAESKKSIIEIAGSTQKELVTTEYLEYAAITLNNSSSNEVGDVLFDNMNTWIGSPSSPITTSISYDLTNSFNGAVACVYYKAPTLSINDASNRIVIKNEGDFVADELCLIWMALDRASGSIHVNVQSGDTGNRPSSLDNQYTLTFSSLVANLISTSFTAHDNFDLTMWIDNWTPSGAQYFASNGLAVGVNGSFIVINRSTAGQIRHRVADSTGDVRYDLSGIVAPTKVRFRIVSGSSMETYLNDVLIDSKSLTGFSASSNTINIGAQTSLGANSIDMVLRKFQIDGELFECNEGSGSTVTGSAGTVCNLVGSPTWNLV